MSSGYLNGSFVMTFEKDGLVLNESLISYESGSVSRPAPFLVGVGKDSEYVKDSIRAAYAFETNKEVGSFNSKCLIRSNNTIRECGNLRTDSRNHTETRVAITGRFMFGAFVSLDKGLLRLVCDFSSPIMQVMSLIKVQLKNVQWFDLVAVERTGDVVLIGKSFKNQTLAIWRVRTADPTSEVQYYTKDLTSF